MVYDVEDVRCKECGFLFVRAKGSGCDMCVSCLGKKYRSVLKEGYARRLDVINEDRLEKMRRRLEGQHGVV